MKKTYIPLTLTLILSALLMQATATPPGAGELFGKANQAYNQGHYEQADSLYRQVEQMGYRSPQLYFNLGNTAFKRNDIPGSILWYERALRLDPGNEEISYNLKVANSRISDKIEPLPELFYIRWYKSLVLTMPTDRWALMTVVAFVVSLLLASAYVASRILIIRKAAFWGSLSTLLISFLFLLMAYSSRSYLHRSSDAIVFSPVVTVKSSPGEKAVDLFVIHEGTRVTLREQIGDWYEIRLANGSVGWVPAGSVERI